MTQTLITPAGLARLREELERLTTIRRQEIAERIRHAVSSERNLVENGDYHDAREEQALLERRIIILQERIVDAEVVAPDAENGVLDVGERVRLRDLENDEEVQYELVGSFEANPFAGRISVASPLGRALLGRRGGEVATVDAPRGRLRFKILEIEGPPDSKLHLEAVSLGGAS